jgi:branched-chain amino acid transport system permease protein
MGFMEWWDGWATYNTVIFSIGVNAMLALSIYVTLSCGLLSLANAAFMGIGAYTASLLTMVRPVPSPSPWPQAACCPRWWRW